MKIDSKTTKFNLEQLVYLRANMDFCGVIVGVIARPGTITYLVTWGDHETNEHYETELVAEKTFE